MEANIENIKNFWNNNPLYYGEVPYEIGSKEYFDQIREIFIKDLFPGEFDERIIPKNIKSSKILDLGSGPGLYTRILYEYGCRDLYSADLTPQANKLVEMLCDTFKYNGVKICNENAEKLTFDDNFFDHVHCSGVIHHTENPNECYREISRVLKKNGTAVIGVYYYNFILRNWRILQPLVNSISYLQPNLKGRGRGGIFKIKDVSEVIRLFDGESNPKGIAYRKNEIISILNEYFKIEDTYLHYFPMRTLNIKLPNYIHRFLDSNFGFMIYLNCIKK